MKTVKLPPDSKAAQVRFGVEIETMIPVGCRVAVGGYHAGQPITGGIDQAGRRIAAPLFDRSPWRADRDGSIVAEHGFTASEFVSPILHGDEGVRALVQMVRFIKAIGGKVNASCGLHVTVGVPSVIGAEDNASIVSFVQKLVRIANHNAWAIYAQTDNSRHLNRYSAPLPPDTGIMTDRMKARPIEASTLAPQCGRGIVNLNKAFRGEQSAVEFRAFAATLSEFRVLHHVATALGIMRRAHETKVFGRFPKSTKKNTARTAPEALRRLWRILGWTDAADGRDCALGLFGVLHTDFFSYRREAMEAAERFETQHPFANLGFKLRCQRMCVILVSPPKARPSMSVLNQCAAANPDGGGIAWVQSGVVQYLKTDDVPLIHRTAQRAEGDVVIHFRIASVGGVCAELRHPFPVTRRAGLSNRSSAPAVLFQNGTWSDWREAVARAEALGHKAPAGRMSDARAAAWLCHVHGRHEWLKSVGWSRWVYLTAAGFVLYGDWKDHDGMRFSNLHWCGRDKSPPPHLACAKRLGPKQASLPFQPSPEFLETASRVRDRRN